MTITKRSILAAAIVLSGLAGAVHAADSVRIATNPPYPPMEYAQPNGTLTGFDIDLGNALCKQAKLECSWTKQNWNGIIPGLMAHKYDAVMAAMTISPERKKQMRFSDTYLVVPSSFFVSKNSALHTIDKASLEGESIGVQRGTTQDRYVTDHFGDVATIKRYQNADDLAVDMSTGRVGVAFLTRITGQRALLDPNPGEYRQAGKSRLRSHVGIAFRKNEQALAEKFDAALKTLKKNGTYQRLYDRYFSQQGEEM